MTSNTLKCLDPITMPPAQLIFSHWELIDQYSSTLEHLRNVSSQGADVSQIREIDARLDIIEDQMNLSEMFLKIGGFTDMEIYQ